MNLYLLGFAVYAALITPVTLRFRLRLGRRTGYLLRLQAAGLPFARKREPNDAREEKPLREQDVAQTIAQTDLALLKALLTPRVRHRLLQLFHWEALSLTLRFAFPDACATALSYLAVESMLRALAMGGALPAVFSAHLSAHFDSGGTEALFEGIATLRLGSLLPAAALFAAAYLRARQTETEEEAYAAASH